MSAAESLTLTYDALNESRTFSEGDTITGQVKLVLSKDIKVQSLFVKAKGDASVRYTRRHGNRDQTYTAHRRYFKLKQFLVAEEDTVLRRGIHVYKFSFNIPQGGMPSSFRGCHGKIVYKLEAKLSRSWRPNRTADQEISFVSKSFPNFQSLMTSQMGSTDKGPGLFSKGNVHMDVILDRGAYAPGEAMAILAKVNNSSSNKMTCKFSLIQEVKYRTHSDSKKQSSTILKVANDIIKPQTQQDVKGTLMIPRDQALSIQHCDILSVKYYVKAYLDISFAFDPEVVFPVVIIPPDLAPHPQCGQGAGAIGGTSNSDFPSPVVGMGAYPAGATRAPSNSDFPPPVVAMGPYRARGVRIPSNSDFHPPAVAMGPYPAGGYGVPRNSYFPPSAVSMGPYPASQHSGSYGYPGGTSNIEPPPEYPGRPAHMSAGYNNPVPQQASRYGVPYSSPSPVLHPPPTAPTFHPPPSAPEIHPPPYSSLPSIAPFAPTYNLLPSAPMRSSDFLSQSDDAPPSYSLIFPPSTSEKSDAK